jgi:hypothetical protein
MTTAAVAPDPVFVDTNVLVYANVATAPLHAHAGATLFRRILLHASRARCSLIFRRHASDSVLSPHGFPFKHGAGTGGWAAEMSTTFGRSVRRWAGACLTLLACGLATPVASRAGCTLGEHAGRGVAHFDRLALAGAMPLSADARPIDPAKPPAPCSGAFCSQSAPVPMPTAPSLSGRTAQQWGCLTEPPTLPASGPSFLPSDDLLCHPSRHGLGIFHPPRPA